MQPKNTERNILGVQGKDGAIVPIRNQLMKHQKWPASKTNEKKAVTLQQRIKYLPVSADKR